MKTVFSIKTTICQYLDLSKLLKKERSDEHKSFVEALGTLNFN